jgi:hypothetical protein
MHHELHLAVRTAQLCCYGHPSQIFEASTGRQPLTSHDRAICPYPRLGAQPRGSSARATEGGPIASHGASTCPGAAFFSPTLSSSPVQLRPRRGRRQYVTPSLCICIVARSHQSIGSDHVPGLFRCRPLAWTSPDLDVVGHDLLLEREAEPGSGQLSLHLCGFRVHPSFSSTESLSRDNLLRILHAAGLWRVAAAA